MDRKTFAKGMYVLLSAYPKEEIGQDTMKVYFEFLGHLTPAQLEKAARRHITQSDWFPKISELLRAVQERLPSAVDAWNRLARAAETGKQPELDYATREALSAIGGWEAFCYTPYIDLRFKVNDFKAAYLKAQMVEKETADLCEPDPVPRLEKK